MRTSEEITEAFEKIFLPDGEEDMDTAIKISDHGGMGLVAARLTSTPDMRLYSWLEEALGSREPYDLYQELVSGAAPARGATIDPGTGALVVVDEGRLMEVRVGDWVVYVPGKGFSVMENELFRDVWECLR